MISGNVEIRIREATRIDEYVLLKKFKAKILKSFLEIAILKEILQRKLITVPSMIESVVNKYAIHVTAGTAYPIFERLEKQGYIKKLPHRLTRTYSITPVGENVLKIVQENSNELENFLVEVTQTQRRVIN